jgi:hypothetical protein
VGSPASWSSCRARYRRRAAARADRGIAGEQQLVQTAGEQERVQDANRGTAGVDYGQIADRRQARSRADYGSMLALRVQVPLR